jgi:peptidyl-prolyl cis-trans isomerase C
LLFVIQILSQFWPTGDKKKAAASHILTKDKKILDELKAQLDKAENKPELFATFAKEHSTCPSGKTGGHLGTFGRGQMVKEFENVVFDPAAKLNEVVGPIETQFGHHLM